MPVASAQGAISARSNAEKPVTKTKAVQLLLSLLTAIPIWWHPLVASFRLAISRDAYTYTLLVLPLSAALIFLQTRKPWTRNESGRWFAVILLSAAILVRVCAAWRFWYLSSTENLSISIGGLVIWWIGCVVLSLGLETSRSLFFPLCFLFLIIPLPGQAVAWITDVLQQQSAFASTMLFRLFGVPVVRDGVVLSIPGLTIEVAQECSSIRSSTMLIIVTLILAHLFLRLKWRQTLLVLTAIPLSILKNAIRIFTIAELGTRVNPSFLNGSLHHHGGVVFLGMALAMVLILMFALRKSEVGQGDAEACT